MVFSVVGNISSTRFKQVAEDKFGDIPSRVSDYMRQGVAPYSPGCRELSKGTYQSHCIMGARACSAMSHDRTAVSLMINVLGGPSAGSRLNIALRERNGLCYTVEAGFTAYCDTGMATLYFGCDRDNLERCISLTEAEIERMKEEPLSPRALSIAKRQLLGQISVASDNSESVMLSAGKSMLLYGDVEPYESLKARVDAVSAEDICKAARRVFDAGEISCLVYR